MCPGTRMYHSYLATLVLAVILHESSESDNIVKCLKVPNEKFQIVCPRGHVIYDPSVLAGVSQTGSCTWARGDCIGQSEHIQHQVDKCYWRNKCEIKLCRKERITCGKDFKGKADPIHYVIIKQAHCIPKDIILDVCSDNRRLRKFDFSAGIIRSDRRYPRPVERDIRRKCNITIPIPQSHTLVARAFWESKRATSYPPNVKVYKIGPPGTSWNRTGVVTDLRNKLSVSGSNVRALDIVAKLGPRKRHRHGFIIPFAIYRTDTLEHLRQWPSGSHDLLKSLDWIFEVKSVIRQCIGSGPGEVTLTCKPNEVIFSTELSASAYTRNQPRCMFGRFPCGGLSADMLVQKNSCYWKNSCKVTWDGERRIILSTKKTCIGYVASNLGIGDIKCVKKSNIFDTCTKITDTIHAKWGVVRSHPDYPWYFSSSYKDCKRIIKIGRNDSLLLIVQDMNLDPDARDKFSVQHVTREGRHEVMNSKTAREGAHLNLVGGRVIIRFKPFATSKAGRGFILMFRKKKTPNQTSSVLDDGHASTKLRGDKALGDMAAGGGAGVTYKRTNRRLCSGSPRDRKKGRSCHARMWTDYFTRID